jgi:hypothetical protein
MILIVIRLCHGRGRGFEPRRPRQILNDLGAICHVKLEYRIVQRLRATGKWPLEQLWKVHILPIARHL